MGNTPNSNIPVSSTPLSLMQPAKVKQDRQYTVPHSGEVHSCTAFGSVAVHSLPAMQNPFH